MSHPNSKSKTSLATLFPFSMRDLIVTALILFVAVAFCIPVSYTHLTLPTTA